MKEDGFKDSPPRGNKNPNDVASIKTSSMEANFVFVEKPGASSERPVASPVKEGSPKNIAAPISTPVASPVKEGSPKNIAAPISTPVASPVKEGSPKNIAAPISTPVASPVKETSPLPDKISTPVPVALPILDGEVVDEAVVNKNSPQDDENLVQVGPGAKKRDCATKKELIATAALIILGLGILALMFTPMGPLAFAGAAIFGGLVSAGLAVAGAFSAGGAVASAGASAAFVTADAVIAHPVIAATAGAAGVAIAGAGAVTLLNQKKGTENKEADLEDKTTVTKKRSFMEMVQDNNPFAKAVR